MEISRKIEMLRTALNEAGTSESSCEDIINRFDVSLDDADQAIIKDKDGFVRNIEGIVAQAKIDSPSYFYSDYDKVPRLLQEIQDSNSIGSAKKILNMIKNGVEINLNDDEKFKILQTSLANDDGTYDRGVFNCECYVDGINLKIKAYRFTRKLLYDY